MPLATARRYPRPLVLGAAAAGLIVVVVVLVLVVASPGGSGRTHGVASPVRQLESIIQDDQLLLDSSTPAVTRTLVRLRRLGVDRIRVTVLWSAIAPDAASPVRPRHFRAGDPDAYPTADWAPYDRLVELAAAHGLAIDFNVTAPGPLWAMAHAPTPRYASHYRPSARAFGQFVTAVGRRYSGTWPVHKGARRRLPRVSFWTIWNEPNQPGWLAPQWRRRAGTPVVDAPVLYRGFVDAGFAALERTGHGPARDTVLIGELAPEGAESTDAETPIPPLTFLRALYCVNVADLPLRGQSATALRCPAAGTASAFVAAHPGLFQPTGFAHHPYSFFLAPGASMTDPNFVPLADLGRLERSLDQILAAYGVHRRLPIYLTEYGYETNPPNPFRGTSLRHQAAYLDEAQYMAWRDPRVQSLAQFLLVDSAPNAAYRKGSIRYWSTFQTGLEFLGGRPKPSLIAYRLPIWVPSPSFARGAPTFVWSMLRPAPNGTMQRASVEWRPAAGGAFRTIATVTTTDYNGVLTDRVRLPGSGSVRIRWVGAGGRPVLSRRVVVRQTG